MNRETSSRETNFLQSLLDTKAPAGANLDEELRRLITIYGCEAVAESAKRLAKPDKRKQPLKKDCWVLAPILRDEARRQLAGEPPSTSTRLVEMAASAIRNKQSENAVYRRLLRRLSMPGMDAYRAIIAIDVAELEFTCVELVKACRAAKKIQGAEGFADIYLNRIRGALEDIWAVGEDVRPDVTFSEMMARGAEARKRLSRKNPDGTLQAAGDNKSDGP